MKLNVTALFDRNLQPAANYTRNASMNTVCSRIIVCFFHYHPSLAYIFAARKLLNTAGYFIKGTIECWLLGRSGKIPL